MLAPIGLWAINCELIKASRWRHLISTTIQCQSFRKPIIDFTADCRSGWLRLKDTWLLSEWANALTSWLGLMMLDREIEDAS